MKKLITLLIVLHTVSCVSMKKFSSVDALLAGMKKDSIEQAKVMIDQNSRIDELLRRNISLGRDTLRLFSNYVTLLEKHERTSEENRQEIVRLSAQLQGTSKRMSNANSGGRVTKMATSIAKSINNLGNDLRQVLCNEEKALWNVESKSWDLVITLHDSLLYVPVMDYNKTVYDHNRLSGKGEYLLGRLASLMIEKDNFDIVVREYIYINSPHLQYIPNAKTESMTLLDKETVVAVIDTLMTRGVVTINTSPSVKPSDTVFSNNRVLDLELSRKQDSIKMAREAERIKQIEMERMAEVARMRAREKRRAADRTTVVMRALMRNCYTNLGKSKLSRDVSYVKAGCDTEMEDNGWIEIILKPNMAELFNIVKEIENRSK